MSYLWGIDLGGTKIEAAVVEEKDPSNVICRERIDTQSEQGYKHILHRIQELIRIVSEKTGQSPSKLGIGTPGALDPQSHLLKNSNTVCLNGQPFLKDLQDLIELSIVIENDANCFALAETIFGAVPEGRPECTGCVWGNYGKWRGRWCLSSMARSLLVSRASRVNGGILSWDRVRRRMLLW